MIFFQPLLISLIGCENQKSQYEDVQPEETIEIPLETTTNEPIPIVGGLPISGDKEIWVETLFDESTMSYHISGTRTLVHQNGEALLIDEASNTTISLGYFDQKSIFWDETFQK